MNHRSNKDGKKVQHVFLSSSTEMKERQKQNKSSQEHQSPQSASQKQYKDKQTQTRAVDEPAYEPYLQVKDPEDGLINVLRILCVDARDVFNIKWFFVKHDHAGTKNSVLYFAWHWLCAQSENGRRVGVNAGKITKPVHPSCVLLCDGMCTPQQAGRNNVYKADENGFVMDNRDCDRCVDSDSVWEWIDFFTTDKYQIHTGNISQMKLVRLVIDKTSFPEDRELSLLYSHWLEMSKHLFVIPGTESYFTGTVSSSPDLQPGHVLLCNGKVNLKMLKAFLCYMLGQESSFWIGETVDICITVVEK